MVSDVFDTVIVAVGRKPTSKNLGLENINVTLSKSNKIVADRNCLVKGVTSNNVYAIGDVVEGNIELTPTAILSGKLLAGRLLNVHSETMSWTNVPTCVFTPIEYGCIGMTEEHCRIH